MSAKILMFDSNRRVPFRHYTPIAMRGRILVMPKRENEATAEPALPEGFYWSAVITAQRRRES